MPGSSDSVRRFSIKMSLLLRHRRIFPSQLSLKWFSLSCSRLAEDDVIHYPDNPAITVPVYAPPPNEGVDQQRARLMYQSRKRGMLENDLLLSTFASKYLKTMNKTQLDVYDRLINDVSNEWNLYYWITKKDPTPPEYESEIMDLLKSHVSNDERNFRCRQPDLY